MTTGAGTGTASSRREKEDTRHSVAEYYDMIEKEYASAGRIYNTLLLQAMALYIHGPLRCKNLLGRIPNPHSRPALAAPQHAPGPHSDARSQRTPPGRSCADQQHHTPQQHRQENAQRHPRTHAAHTHTAQIRHPAAHAGSCAAPAAPHDQAHRQQPRTEHTPEPFYQPSNMEALRRSIDEMQQGKTVTKTLEELTALEDD